MNEIKKTDSQLTEEIKTFKPKKTPYNFQKNECYFCKETINSYIEVRGFCIRNGMEIDEVIPICHFCWFKEYITVEIPCEYGYGKDYLDKEVLEDYQWNEEEIRHLSEYYLKNRKAKEVNDFVHRWFHYGLKNELEETIELLEKEKEWNECYEWIKDWEWGLGLPENVFRYNLLKRNLQLKELYQKIEKTDLEELWKKEIQQEIIPIWKEIKQIQEDSRKNNICNLCYSRTLITKIPKKPDLAISSSSKREPKEEDLDYMCEKCIDAEISLRESIEENYFDGVRNDRYKVLVEWIRRNEPKEKASIIADNLQNLELLELEKKFNEFQQNQDPYSAKDIWYKIKQVKEVLVKEGKCKACLNNSAILKLNDIMLICEPCIEFYYRELGRKKELWRWEYQASKKYFEKQNGKANNKFNE
jgi:hypothetical protein